MFCCIVIATRWTILYDPYVFSFNSQHYTRLDRIPHEMFTPDIIKNAPGLTAHAMISYYPQSPSSENIEITYVGRQGLMELEKYLLSLGYKEDNDLFFGKS